MEQNNDVKIKLDNARKKLILIKKQEGVSDYLFQLKALSELRDNVCNDSTIMDYCNNDKYIFDLRKSLLDEIRNYQTGIISGIVKLKKNVSGSAGRSIIDFDKAKISLSNMVEDELKADMFSNSLFKNIEECKAHISTLRRVKDNCLNDKYKVLIMGDFQSGKSTTLDALCDGRHISAIGNGTATSAVLVSATYAEEESINISWRDKLQFKTIFNHIIKYLPDFDWNKFDLDNHNSRNRLAQAIDKFRNSKHCPNLREGDAKFLMLSDFVLKYYGTEELKQKKDSLSSVSDISDITRFPKNGESEWQKNGMRKFNISDVIFIFINRVDCYIPSNTLRKLNCTVIDSPGLFNSSYDTMVTEAAMIEAHAIVYLLPYHKGIGEGVCKSLFAIRDNYKDVHKKLFVVNNIRLTDDSNFAESNLEQIHSMFGEDKQVCCYDAKLAYLAQLKKTYDSSNASESDYGNLLHVTRKSYNLVETKMSFSTFDDAWSYHIKNYAQAGICPDTTPDKIIVSSGFEGMINDLKQFIADNKAYSVILSNGINIMANELEGIRNSLRRLYIEPFISSYDKLKDLWQIRIGNAKQIRCFINQEVSKEILGTKLCKQISDEEYSKLFTLDFYKEISEEVASVLYDNKAKLLLTKTLFKNRLNNPEAFKKRFSEIATPMITQKIVELVSRKIGYMYEVIGKGEDSTISTLFFSMMYKIETAVADEWRKLYKDDDCFEMKNYFEIPKNLIGNKQKIDQCPNEACSFLSPALDITLLGGLVAEITVVVVGIATMIGSYIATVFCDLSGTSILIATFFGIGATLVELMAPQAIKDQCVKFLSKNILPVIHGDKFVESFREIVYAGIRQTICDYVISLKINFARMKNERDVALSQSPNQEALCFQAVEMSMAIDDYLQRYEEYKKNNVK
jgi:hypothetical protein